MTPIIYITPAGRAAFDLRTARFARLVEAKAVSLPGIWPRVILDDMPPPAAPAVPVHAWGMV
ncbi:MAG: hypothetical protein AAFQ58_19110 [Pseudomonadota bacterium]